LTRENKKKIKRNVENRETKPAKGEPEGFATSRCGD
jgi:hypothetical protein